MPRRGCSAASRTRPCRRRSCSNGCSRSRSASPTTSAASPRTMLTTDGLRAGRECAAAPLGGLAAPAGDRVARGGDAAEPGEEPEREHVQGWNPDPIQHVPSVARTLLTAYEAAQDVLPARV